MSPPTTPTTLPFSAVVGQDQAKLALLLAACEPRLGGVLLRGDKGSAKTTLARSLAGLLPGDAPFVELPLGATEDRVVGSVDLASLLRDGKPAVRLGLLAAAHGGVLYVDEINLLADHLVDVLLDVAVSGVNRIERDGVAHQHPARFVLIGSMNPEEGELRPQLLDRFGLSVEVTMSTDIAQRTAAVRRRLSFDADGRTLDDFARQDEELRVRLAHPVPVSLDDRLIELACRLAVEVGAEGLRGDLMLCRAAAAHAAWRGSAVAIVEDLRAVAPLALGHRRRRSPLDPPGIDQSEIDDALNRSQPPDAPSDSPTDEPPQESPTDESPTDGSADEGSPPSRPPAAPADPPIAAPHWNLKANRANQDGRRNLGSSSKGRFVRSEPVARGEHIAASDVAVIATATATATAGRVELQRAQRVQRTGSLVILCVDASGSMGADRRMEQTKGAVLGLLADAYQRRDRVALVTFAGERADIVLRPTASIEIARARLAELPTGGTSPIAAGLDAAVTLARGTSGDQSLEPLLVLVSDGRATGGPDALDASRSAARRIAAAGLAAVVVDAETGATRLGLARELANAMAATCLHLDDLVDGSLERTIRLRLQ